MNKYGTLFCPVCHRMLVAGDVDGDTVGYVCVDCNLKIFRGKGCISV